MAESLGIIMVSTSKIHGKNRDKSKGSGKKSLVVMDYLEVEYE